VLIIDLRLRDTRAVVQHQNATVWEGRVEEVCETQAIFHVLVSSQVDLRDVELLRIRQRLFNLSKLVLRSYAECVRRNPAALLLNFFR